MRHDDDEDGQGKDEGDGCHGNDKPFGLSGVVVVPSECPVAIVVSSSVHGAATKAVVSHSVDSPRASPKAIHDSLRVPGQRGGNASKYTHGHDEDHDAHDFDDAWRRRPAVEMLELVVWVVGIGRLGGGFTVKRVRRQKKHSIKYKYKNQQSKAIRI